MALDSVLENLISTSCWDEAIQYCRKQSANEPFNCVWNLYEGIVHEEKRDNKEAEASYKKAYLIDNDLGRHAIHLKEMYTFLFQTKKTPGYLQKLKFISCLHPKDDDLLRYIIEQDSTYRNYQTPEIVFFTGTLPRKTFSPDSLKTEGLGGSETAFVVMAQKLKERGFKVACFCNTPVRKNYNGVDYFPIVDYYAFQLVHQYPLLIASRFLYPISNSRLKNHNILWLHDMEMPLHENVQSELDKLQRIFVLSDYQKKFVQEQFKIPEEKLFRTTNGFLSEHFDPHFVAKPNRRLFYMSRPERGLAEAIRVFKALRHKYADLELHVCTYTNSKSIEDDPELAPFREDLKTPNLIFHGSQPKEKLYSLLKESSILLYPNTSYRETSCITAMEAMACGIPVVTSNRGALPETLNQGGIIVPYNMNHDQLVIDLAKAVDLLLTDTSTWETCSKNGKVYAWSHYLWDQVADQWAALIRDQGWTQ